jgi:hypothetical protein
MSDEFSPEEAEERKKAVFDSMSPRRQKHILNRVGYEKWDPFQEPKDPIDIRKDKSKRTTQQLVREFLQTRQDEGYSNAYSRGVFYSNAYSRGVLELALGIVNEEERFIGMYEFASWYRDILKREGHE